MKRYLLAAGAALSFAAAANATVAVTFTYDDLSGNYVGGLGGGTFTAYAANFGSLNSAGEVSRILGSALEVGDASFAPGFVSGLDPSDFTLTMTVSGIGGGMATGVGSFIITDADGDTITGNISGTFMALAGFIAFNGALSNVQFNGSFAGDTFNGTDGPGSFVMLDGPPSVYDGAIVSLTTGASSFFGANFSDAATGVTGQITIVPLPPAAMAGIGGLALVGAGAFIRRRRMNAAIV